MRKLLILVIASALPASAAAVFSFSLLPANIDGLPGATVGWGFSLANNSTAGEELFIDSTPTPDHTPVLAQSGSFTLFMDWDNVDLQPGQSLMDDFSSSTSAGIAELTIDPNASPGAVESGNFTIVFDFLDQNSTLTQQTQAYSYQLTVDAPAFQAVPEPAYGITAGGVILAFALVSRGVGRLRGWLLAPASSTGPTP